MIKTLKIFPSTDLKLEAHVAWEGAKYHMEILNNLSKKPYFLLNKWREDTHINESQKQYCRAKSNSIHWHLRSFFWEMFSCFEIILHYSNLRYDLKIPEERLRWDTISKPSIKANIDQHEWDIKYLLLKDIWDSPWFFEVRQYRHFAHRAYPYVKIAYKDIENDGKIDYEIALINLLPCREGQQQSIDLANQLADYLNGMLTLLKKFFS